MDMQHKKKLLFNDNFDGAWCRNSFIPMKNEVPLNLLNEWDWHAFKLRSRKQIQWVSLQSSYGKKILTLNILWIHQPSLEEI
jgi:hypothetical protein